MVKINTKQHVTKDGIVKRNPKKSSNDFYEKVIINAISTDGFDLVKQPKTTKEKLEFLKERFQSEYGYAINRIGYQDAMRDWYQGLAIDIPFYNNDIIELAKKGGSLPQNATEKQEDKIIENYWSFMARKTLGLFRKYKVM